MDNVLESTTLILGFVLAFLQRILGTPAMPNALEMDNVSLNAFLDRSVRKDTWNMDLQLVMIQVWVECPRTKNKKQNQAKPCIIFLFLVVYTGGLELNRRFRLMLYTS